MPTGRIKYYNLDKGFGFIAQDNSEEDVFLHSSAIKHADYEELRVGQRVKYIVVEGERGLVAKNVEVILTPTERRWLRQGKTIIPRGYSGFPNNNQDQFYSENKKTSDKASNDEIESGLNHLVGESKEGSESASSTTETDSESDSKATHSRQLSFGDLYILKQINFETQMFFALYDEIELPATVLEMTLSGLTLNCNGKERTVQKAAIKYCFKDIDAEMVKTLLSINEDVKSKQLTPVDLQENVFTIDSASIQQSANDQKPIEITLREGEVFRGSVDWISPYEIKLVLKNGSKVVVFRHAIFDLKVIEEEI